MDKKDQDMSTTSASLSKSMTNCKHNFNIWLPLLRLGFWSLRWQALVMEGLLQSYAWGREKYRIKLKSSLTLWWL